MANYHQPPLPFIHHITLNVQDPKKMTDFYLGLGMKVFQQDASLTILGTGRPLLTLKHDQPYPVETKATQGLYHVAYLVPSRAALGSILNHLIKNRYPLQGLSDHGVSEAIYLADPEGNGIEIYADRPRMLWPFQGKQLAMITERMKYQEVLALATPFEGMREDTIIGHLHLHVSDLAKATAHYQSTLNYERIQHYRDSAVFLSAGGYHHHLGINTWNGQGIPTKNPNTTGLIGYTIYGTAKPTIHDIAGLMIQFQS